MAVQVLRILQSKYPTARLVMAGPDKGMLREVQRYVENWGRENAVRFAGFLDHAGKCAEGGKSDIFLNTNRVDNSPVSVMEACAMGLPVVSTDVGGIPHTLKHERDCLLVPNEDLEAMAAAIARLIEDPELSSRLSQAGYELASQCDWKSVRKQ